MAKRIVFIHGRAQGQNSPKDLLARYCVAAHVEASSSNLLYYADVVADYYIREETEAIGFGIQAEGPSEGSKIENARTLISDLIESTPDASETEKEQMLAIVKEEFDDPRGEAKSEIDISNLEGLVESESFAIQFQDRIWWEFRMAFSRLLAFPHFREAMQRSTALQRRVTNLIARDTVEFWEGKGQLQDEVVAIVCDQLVTTSKEHPNDQLQVVAHSMGTTVMPFVFERCHSQGSGLNLLPPVFIGSPLGLTPFGDLEGKLGDQTMSWIRSGTHFYDESDPVAFCGVKAMTNEVVPNPNEDKHLFEGYLSLPRLQEAISIGG